MSEPPVLNLVAMNWSARQLPEPILETAPSESGVTLATTDDERDDLTLSQSMISRLSRLANK